MKICQRSWQVLPAIPAPVAVESRSRAAPRTPTRSPLPPEERHDADPPTHPHRHRHRRHVHRRRRLRRGLRRAGHHQDAVHAGQPGRRLHHRRRARCSTSWAPTGADVTAVCHGTTVATNQLLEGKVERLGFITTEGYEFMLEIARQAVPDGYGNSYFWVKPPRIVPADRVRTVGGRIDFEGNEIRPVRRGRRRRRRPLVPRPRHHHDRRLLPALLRQRRPRAARCARSCRASTPRRSSRSRSEVLREYREYERSMTTLVDAAVKPNVGALRRQHPQPARRLRRAGDPVLRHEVQRRRALGRRGRAPADHDRAVRPGGRRARAPP